MQPLTPKDTHRVDPGPFLGERQCTADCRLTGIRCKRPPVAGGVVCPLHGGASPLAKQKAERMLLSLVEPAVTTLFDALEAVDAVGQPIWPVRVTAAKALLDRSGYGPSSKISFEKPRDDFSKYTTDELARELSTLAAAANEQAAKVNLLTPESGEEDNQVH